MKDIKKKQVTLAIKNEIEVCKIVKNVPKKSFFSGEVQHRQVDFVRHFEK